MEQKANITIDNHHITVERMQTACGREIRVISVFPRHGSETAEDKLKALAELDFQPNTLGRALYLSRKKNKIGILVVWCRNALNGLAKKRRAV